MDPRSKLADFEGSCGVDGFEGTCGWRINVAGDKNDETKLEIVERLAHIEFTVKAFSFVRSNDTVIYTDQLGDTVTLKYAIDVAEFDKA